MVGKWERDGEKMELIQSWLERRAILFCEMKGFAHGCDLVSYMERINEYASDVRS